VHPDNPTQLIKPTRQQPINKIVPVSNTRCEKHVVRLTHRQRVIRVHPNRDLTAPDDVTALQIA
jgi:hypothetical protein